MDEEGRRFNALQMAIKSNSGHDYNDDGKDYVNPDKIIEASKKFEAFLKGTENG